jgi:hypothetical protein
MPVTDNSDVLYIDEYAETTMISASIDSALAGISMAQPAFTRHYHGIDDLPPDVIDSIILNLLEDFARLDCDAEAAPWNRGRAEGPQRRKNRALVFREDAQRAAPRGSLGDLNRMIVDNEAAPSGAR